MIDTLVERMRGLSPAVLAYSGGVDSSLLLKTMSMAGGRALAVTGRSEATPIVDIEDATRLAAECGIPHRIINTNELSNPAYAANSPERCYHCKDELFSLLAGIAKAEGYITIIEGSNLDDTHDHRPGRTASARHGAISPLVELGITKQQVRQMSHALGLWTADKPSSPCLGSRFPYGTAITPAALARVARAEGYLRGLGFREFRVRHHEGLARLEFMAADLARALEVREGITTALREMGYDFVCMDMEGFRSGSLNRVLNKPPCGETAGHLEKTST